MRRGREAAHIARPWAVFSSIKRPKRRPSSSAWPVAAGRRPRNKGRGIRPIPPKVEEISAVVRAAGDDAHGVRLRGLIVILWRAEALALAEAISTRTAALARAPRQGRPAPRGRNGRVGLGAAAA